MLHLESVAQLLDLAKERHGFRFDAELARRLGVSGNHVKDLRYGGRWPSDETVIKLADLAVVDRVATLVRVQYWRATSKEAQETWEKAWRFLQGAGAAVALTVL